MLYVQVRVNGIDVKAMVDTGAQMTIMNTKCAERCNVMRLVDRRGAGIAVGVGRQRIIGVVHMCQIQVGQDYLASSFRILEDQSHELILGLDMLKRHQVREGGGDGRDLNLYHLCVCNFEKAYDVYILHYFSFSLLVYS